MTLTFGSLFAGIGGIDLGLERAGMRCRWQSEIDPYASRVLAKHWPDIPNLGDIRDIDWTTVERTDVVAGGYPCQPFSSAGYRQGQHDPRHLWPEFARTLRILRPRYAIMENVAGHLSLGFGDVLKDLAALGYDCRWDCVPAASVGAPHRRDRVFIIAYTPQRDGGQPQQPGMDQTGRPTKLGKLGWGKRPGQHWQNNQPGVGRVADGIPSALDRLRTLGNAVVPQVAEHIGRIIMEQHT